MQLISMVNTMIGAGPLLPVLPSCCSDCARWRRSAEAKAHSILSWSWSWHAPSPWSKRWCGWAEVCCGGGWAGPRSPCTSSSAKIGDLAVCPPEFLIVRNSSLNFERRLKISQELFRIFSNSRTFHMGGGRAAASGLRGATFGVETKRRTDNLIEQFTLRLSNKPYFTRVE